MSKTEIETLIYKWAELSKVKGSKREAKKQIKKLCYEWAKI